MTSLKINLAFFKAEMTKAWNKPTLEFAVGILTLISITSVTTLVKIVEQSHYQSSFQSMVADAISKTMSTQLLPLTIFCGVLVSMSFARDYEQGLMQTLLSLPISRKTIFTVKFLAILIPLTFISWGLMVFALTITFYSNLTAVLTILQLAIWALPMIFLALMFYGGIATLVSLTLRRTIPAVLTAMLAGFFVWYITTLKDETIGTIANYICLSPYEAPKVGLNRMLEIPYPSNTLESILPGWSFVIITLFYALAFLVPMYLHFTRRFELRE
jgi:ABC-type transport system involved in multi-copper enzyme maturation permease subunit